MNRINCRVWILIFLIIAKYVYSNPLDSEANEYSNRYSLALNSNNRVEIEKCIEYFKNIIKNGNESKIKSVYYNLAQLYYKLEQYNDAIETLDQWNSPAKDYYKATLEIKIGNIQEAKIILKKILNSLDKYFYYNNSINTISLSNYISYSNYLGFDYNERFNDMIEKGLVTKEQVEDAKNVISMFDENVLINLWPK